MSVSCQMAISRKRLRRIPGVSGRPDPSSDRAAHEQLSRGHWHVRFTPYGDIAETPPRDLGRVGASVEGGRLETGVPTKGAARSGSISWFEP